MKRLVKIYIVIVGIIFSGVAIILKGNLNVDENINVVSESEINKTQYVNNEKNNYNKKKQTANKKENQNINKSATVFVSGEVKNPGVVTIDVDKRLADAVEKLGGFTENADLNKINLAIKIEDEKHYIIPKIGKDIEMNTEVICENNANEQNNLVNINEADIKQLDTLPGIGEATASKIINYRKEKGKFNAIEEIKNVNGIGDKKYENMKDIISIK